MGARGKNRLYEHDCLNTKQDVGKQKIMEFNLLSRKMMDSMKLKTSSSKLNGSFQGTLTNTTIVMCSRLKSMPFSSSYAINFETNFNNETQTIVQQQFLLIMFLVNREQLMILYCISEIELIRNPIICVELLWVSLVNKTFNNRVKSVYQFIFYEANFNSLIFLINRYYKVQKNTVLDRFRLKKYIR